MTRLLLLVGLLAAPSTAWAQHFEIAPLTLAGYTSAVTLEPRTAGIDELKIEGGSVWAAQGGFVFPNGFGVEVLVRRQQTGVSLSSGGRGVTLFDMRTYDVDANLTYQLGHAQTLEPFVAGGVGSTFFSSDGLDRQAFAAFNIGAGVKWYVLRHVGLRLDARYRVTRLNASPNDYCVPFAFCQRAETPFQLGGGVLLRF